MKQHPTARELLAEIERFLHRHDMNPTTFGIDCMNDGNYLSRLRRGRTPTLQTIDKVRAYIKRRIK